MDNVIVIGGGIIGLSAAYYLQQAGHRVTVLDKGDFLDNCSYGNCGYVCPSHFIPLATPGIVRQGLKWMWNPKSPFYVQPRLSRSLIDWGWKFMKSATAAHVERSAAPLRDIALLRQHEYESWIQQPGFDFSYEHRGLLEIFQTAAGAEHAHHTVETAHRLGLSDTQLLNYEELQAKEPHTKINALGAIFFKCDAHLYPNRLMEVLRADLRQKGVALIPQEEVIRFGTSNGGTPTGGGRISTGNSITTVETTNNHYPADAVVLATGSWSREIAALLDTRLPLMPGRGYSVTLEDATYPSGANGLPQAMRVNYPAILMEGRAAITPMDGNKIRFGGTMEVTSMKTPPRYNRVQGILDAVRRFFPEFDVPMPPREKIWWGYRPCSADGLPYIGRIKKYNNVVVATGHSMLGLSLGPGTGKLVAELVSGQPTSIDLSPFAVERFG